MLLHSIPSTMLPGPCGQQQQQLQPQQPGALARIPANLHAALQGRSHQQATRRSRVTVTRAAAQDDTAPSTSTRPPAAVAVPRSPEETVTQAVETIKRAWEDGVTRQRVQYLLPLIGATELDDWPGGIRQQFKAAAPMLEQMLLELKREPELSGRLAPSILDDGDAVGAWVGERLSAVLFPTAETLRELRGIAEGTAGLCLIANPQWQGGQVISDFGLGPWRARNEELAGSFVETYTFKQLRIQGEDVRILYAYPGAWQVHVAEDDGALPLVWTGGALPDYTELEAILRARPGSKASMTWAQRLQREIEFNSRQ